MASLLQLAIWLSALLLPGADSSSLSLQSGTTVNGSHSDLDVLLAFKGELADPTGVLARSWTTNVSFCRWLGVSCSRRHQQRITALSLPDVPLQGELSPHLSNLSFLSMLNLKNTSLAGSIPAELGMLHRLKVLHLFENGLTGPIPSAIGNLTSLEYLNLGFNSLSGDIPPGLLQNMHSLEKFYLGKNELTGRIPLCLFNNTQSLRWLGLMNNSLSGPIPHNLGSLPKLELFNLGYNNPSGIVPPNIYNMSRMWELDLSGNNFAGPIPNNQSFSLPLLQFLGLSHNNFVGPIPSGLAAWKYLESLSLSDNYFVDFIPTWLAQLPRLTFLSLNKNNLVGSIPAVLSNLTQSVNWSDSKFSSELFGIISTISVQEKAVQEKLFGIISTFRNIPALNLLELGSNNLDGNLNFLSSLSNCRKLQYIDLVENSFIGGLPDHIWNLSTDLLWFNVDYNKLTGWLPSTLSNLSHFETLGLFNNLFTGD